MHLRNWRSQRLQIWCKGWMCKSHPTDDSVPDRGVVRSCDPLQNFGGSNHITGTAEPKVIKFCTWVGYINSNKRMTYHQQKGVVMVSWSRDCFKILPFVVMQRVERVCQRQLSYLFFFKSRSRSLKPICCFCFVAHHLLTRTEKFLYYLLLEFSGPLVTYSLFPPICYMPVPYWLCKVPLQRSAWQCHLNKYILRKKLAAYGTDGRLLLNANFKVTWQKLGQKSEIRPR